MKYMQTTISNIEKVIDYYNNELIYNPIYIIGNYQYKPLSNIESQLLTKWAECNLIFSASKNPRELYNNSFLNIEKSFYINVLVHLICYRNLPVQLLEYIGNQYGILENDYTTQLKKQVEILKDLMSDKEYIILQTYINDLK